MWFEHSSLNAGDSPVGPGPAQARSTRARAFRADPVTAEAPALRLDPSRGTGPIGLFLSQSQGRLTLVRRECLRRTVT